MKLVIDLRDEAYEGIMKANQAGGRWDDSLLGILCKSVSNGTPLQSDTIFILYRTDKDEDS